MLHKREDQMQVADIFLLQPDNPHHSNPPEGSRSEPEARHSSKHRRVMVVDDEMLVAESLVEILRMEGFQAIAVSDGAAAVKWAEILEPDTIICDIAMPRMDGFAVAEQIRELLPECRIILFSGHAGMHRKLADAQAEGLEFEFLAKPVKPEIVLSMLRNPKLI